jgi:ABC-2 type transport system permease protein
MNPFTNVGAIVQKEWRHYFGGPIAYVVIAVWTLLFGLFFTSGVGFFVQQGMRLMGGGTPLGEYLIQPLMHNMSIAAMFLLPMLTMRLFAEEKRTGTIELLATTPITDLQIVIGKFLAACGLWLMMIVAGLLNLSILWKYATPGPEIKPVLTATLALFLFGASYIALGTFLSTVTKNQVVSAVLTFCLFLGILILSWGDDPTAGPVAKSLAYLSFTTHLHDLMKGVIDLKDLVFYASAIAFGIFISHQSVASERWRS